MSQVPEHPPACTLIASHMSVDRHVAERYTKLLWKRFCNLLRAPLPLGQKRLDMRIDLRRVVLHLPATPRAAIGMFLLGIWAIYRIARGW